jgi:hypothetical protein
MSEQEDRPTRKDLIRRLDQVRKLLPSDSLFEFGLENDGQITARLLGAISALEVAAEEVSHAAKIAEQRSTVLGLKSRLAAQESILEALEGL